MPAAILHQVLLVSVLWNFDAQLIENLLELARGLHPNGPLCGLALRRVGLGAAAGREQEQRCQ